MSELASRMFAAFRCRFAGHTFVEVEAKRHCSRCGREEWLMSNPYPMIGEPKYYWFHMDRG